MNPACKVGFRDGLNSKEPNRRCTEGQGRERGSAGVNRVQGGLFDETAKGFGEKIAGGRNEK